MSFQITVEPSGRTFQADSDEILLTAGIRQGIGLPYGCKDGACGSCKCKVISGEVSMGDHQAKALSAEEKAQGLILTCRSTAKSDLVLESKQVVEEGAFPIKKMPVRVFSLERKTQDVMLVKLQVPAGDLIKYKAGQYVDFLLGNDIDVDTLQSYTGYDPHLDEAIKSVTDEEESFEEEDDGYGYDEDEDY